MRALTWGVVVYAVLGATWVIRERLKGVGDRIPLVTKAPLLAIGIWPVLVCVAVMARWTLMQNASRYAVTGPFATDDNSHLGGKAQGGEQHILPGWMRPGVDQYLFGTWVQATTFARLAALKSGGGVCFVEDRASFKVNHFFGDARLVNPVYVVDTRGNVTRAF